ncbi:MAG: hypothetical protein RL347_1915 [Actinomycetota bacterium]|jgi:hypothetical protein
MLEWIWRTMGTPPTTMSSAIGALDAVFDPSAARAREALETQHERVMPTPSPGDRLLDEGRLVINLASTPPAAAAESDG